MRKVCAQLVLLLQFYRGSCSKTVFVPFAPPPLVDFVLFFMRFYRLLAREFREIRSDYNWLVRKRCVILGDCRWLVRELREILGDYRWLIRKLCELLGDYS